MVMLSHHRHPSSSGQGGRVRQLHLLHQQFNSSAKHHSSTRDRIPPPRDITMFRTADSRPTAREGTFVQLTKRAHATRGQVVLTPISVPSAYSHHLTAPWTATEVQARVRNGTLIPVVVEETRKAKVKEARTALSTEKVRRSLLPRRLARPRHVPRRPVPHRCPGGGGRR